MLPFIAALPPMEQERVVCSISAAVKYEIPANILLAVAEKEGGRPGQWVRNTNKTDDVGPMQFNTAYLRDLARYGITANDVAAAGCYSFELAAWRLRMHIRNDTGDLWTRAANYHSRTQKYNSPYREDLIRKASKWANWLETHFVTVDIKGGAAPRIPGQHAATTQVAQQTNEAAKRNLSSYVPRRVSFTVPSKGNGE